MAAKPTKSSICPYRKQVAGMTRSYPSDTPLTEWKL